MLRVLEEFSWHYTGVELLAEHLDKFGCTAHPEPRKYRCAEAARRTLEIGMSSQEFVHQNTIRFQQSTGSITHPIEIVEDDHGQEFGWMHRAAVGEINDLPHALY